MQAAFPFQKTYPTFPGDPALRHRTPTRKRKGRLRGAHKFDKRAERHATWGRMMEERVSGILEGMVRRGLITRFVYHEPNSSEDMQGKDFTVWKMKDGEEMEYSFGITISPPKRSSLPRVSGETVIPLWHLPINTKDDTIVRKVLAL